MVIGSNGVRVALSDRGLFFSHRQICTAIPESAVGASCPGGQFKVWSGTYPSKSPTAVSTSAFFMYARVYRGSVSRAAKQSDSASMCLHKNNALTK
jgi:hypothetical protein